MTSRMTEDDYKKLNASQLRSQLKKRKLGTNGKKDELVSRCAGCRLLMNTSIWILFLVSLDIVYHDNNFCNCFIKILQSKRVDLLI